MYNYEVLPQDVQEVITADEWSETVDRVINTLNKYSDHGDWHDGDVDWDVCAITKNLMSWAKGKVNMIRAMKNHPTYNASEPWKIIHDVDAERILDMDKVRDFGHMFLINDTHIYLEDGTSMWISCDTLLSDTILGLTSTFITDEDVKAYESYRDYDTYSWFKNEKYFAPNIPYSDELYAKVCKVNPHVGQKTNKFIRKLITAICGSVDEKAFAIYSDALNPTMFKRKASFSVDPVDFLLMSHGNSWASCYWINKHDPGSYQGCYSNGTWSYMNDSSTAIMSVVDNDCVKNFAEQPKIFRQCVFFNGIDTIVNSRVYPSDENNSTIRKEFRGYAQQFISELFDLGNNWKAEETEWNKKIFDSFNVSDVIEDDDYFVGYNDPQIYNLSVSINKASETAKENRVFKKMRYGAKAYCPVCGEYWYGGTESRYVCEKCDEAGHRCDNCGNHVSEDEIHWCEDVGEYRCEDCCFYCDYYGDWRTGDSYTVYRRNGWGSSYAETWCEDAVDYHAVYCDECEEYWASDEVTYIEKEDRTVCPDCLDDYYSTCDDCGEYVRNDSLLEYEDPETGELLMLCEDCYEKRIAKEREKAEENEESEVC